MDGNAYFSYHCREGKPAIEWIMERYQITTHKESQIPNDPNLWCDKYNQPRYIIDLLKRIVTLSLETMKIVKSLPEQGLFDKPRKSRRQSRQG